MMIISAFADEISADLEEQLDVLESENIHHIEFRGVWGKNVLDLSDQELQKVKDRFDERGFRLSSVGSPIGKIGIKDDFESHLKRFDRALHVAKFFDTPYIRIFSFFIPKEEFAEPYRDEVVYRMRELTKRAAAAGKVLLHENEKGIFGDTGDRCRELLEAVNSPHLRAIVDPANFVQVHQVPYPNCFESVENHLEYIHIKDALKSGQVVPPGEGDGRLAELLADLQGRGYEGFLSIEPHLASSGTFSGFSGPQLFKVAAGALKKLLKEQQIEWR